MRVCLEVALVASGTTHLWYYVCMGGDDNRPHTQIHSACSCSTFPHCSVFIANILIRVNGVAA